MTNPNPLDPFGLMRNWVGEWEKLVNQHGAEWLEKPEVAQAMQKLSEARLAAQGATSEGMERVLALAQLPSKADVEALGARLAGIEATLARVEAHLHGRTVPGSAAPRPRRTRKPGS